MLTPILLRQVACFTLSYHEKVQDDKKPRYTVHLCHKQLLLKGHNEIFSQIQYKDNGSIGLWTFNSIERLMDSRACTIACKSLSWVFFFHYAWTMTCDAFDYYEGNSAVQLYFVTKGQLSMLIVFVPQVTV